LCGGSQLDLGFDEGECTLGIIALATAGGRVPVGTPVILTSTHGTLEGSRIGQPRSPCGSWCCVCRDVGKLVHCNVTRRVDASIATINEGVRYTHEILEFGAVQGRGQAADLVAGDPVFKRGRGVKPLRGVFSSATTPEFTRTDDQFTFEGQIRVTPVAPDPPATIPERFQLKGDTGAVLIDVNQRVIGILHTAEITPTGNSAFASHIDHVMEELHIDIVAMPGGGLVTLSGSEQPEADAIEERLDALLATYGSRDAGRRLWRLVQQHRDEVVRMVRTHKPTALTWRRCQGPSFVSHYIKTLQDDRHLAPEQIGGMRIENLVLGMATTLQRDGSPALSRAIRRHYLDILEAARGCRRVDSFLDRMTQQPRDRHLDRSDQS